MAPPTTEDGSTPANSDSSAQPQATAGSNEMGSSSSDRPWERAWTVVEMRNHAGNWSLAADAGMLQHLQQFSQRMVSRTHEISEQVNSLLHEVKLTGVRVNNTFNDFIMLANAQFVENRVYDEEVTTEVTTEEKKPEAEKTKEQREGELIPRISEAMKLGLNVIDRAFEKLDVGEANSDSDDDEDSRYKTDPILEAKDPYLQRALPHIIGSQAFMQDDDVGLVDLPSDEEAESDHGSLSESESESEDEIQTSQPQKRTSTKVDESDSDDSEYTTDTDSEDEKRPQPSKKAASDIFGAGDSDEDSEDESSRVKVNIDEDKVKDEEKEEDTSKKGPVDFQSELASKLGGGVPPPQKTAKKSKTDNEASKQSKPKGKTKKVVVDDDDLFGPPPLPDDDEDLEDEASPFSSKGGLFSTSSKGLFDEDDDDGGGLFDDVPAKPKPKPAPKKEKSTDCDSA